MRVSVSVACGLALGASLLTGSPAQAAVHKPLPGVSNCGTDKPRVHRENFIATCGDGGVNAHNLRWTALHQFSGAAHGTLVVLICVPDCAQGHDRSFPATMTFGRVSNEDGVPAFHVMTVHFPKAIPPGYHRSGNRFSISG